MKILLDWFQTDHEELMGYSHLPTTDLLEIQVKLELVARFARHLSICYYPYLARGLDTTQASVYRDNAILMYPQPSAARMEQSAFVTAIENIRPPGPPIYLHSDGREVFAWCWQLDRGIARRLNNITTALRTCRILLSDRQDMTLAIMHNDFTYLNGDCLEPPGFIEGIQHRQEIEMSSDSD